MTKLPGLLLVAAVTASLVLPIAGVLEPIQASGDVSTIAPDDVPDVTDAELDATISDLELPVENIVVPEPKDVVTESADDGQRVIGLDSDILFDFASASVVPAGSARIGELVADLPQGSALGIGGHTDSIGDDVSNLTLSQQRAEAVAAIVRAARADLVLTVTGYGESQPVAPNTTGAEDNPEGRALNRRVELRVG